MALKAEKHQKLQCQGLDSLSFVACGGCFQAQKAAIFDRCEVSGHGEEKSTWHRSSPSTTFSFSLSCTATLEDQNPLCSIHFLKAKRPQGSLILSLGDLKCLAGSPSVLSGASKVHRKASGCSPKSRSSSSTASSSSSRLSSTPWA